MSWIYPAIWTLQTLTVALLIYSAIESRATTWLLRQATLWHSDPGAARVRAASPPPSVRLIRRRWWP